MPPQSTVTVLGLGGMGSALARALIRRGYDVVVWNRTPARALPLMESGARLAGSVAEAIAASPLTVICVLDQQASQSLLRAEGVAEAIAGKTIVDMTSALPEEVLAQQARVCGCGGRFVAGGIMAFPAGIGRPDTLMLYAGDGAAFEQHRSTLACLGGSLEYLGPDPRATFNVYATLGVFLEGSAALFLETSTVARQFGIPMETYFRLTRLGRDMLHNQLADCADRVVTRRFGGEEASIDLHLHWVEAMRATFAGTGIPVKMTEAFTALLQLASARGHGTSDVAAIAETLWAERGR